jgi:hypothetical protein
MAGSAIHQLRTTTLRIEDQIMPVDAYLLLTPLLVLAIVGLLRFIGCVLLVHPATPGAPRELVTQPFDHRIELSWLAASSPLQVEFGTQQEGSLRNRHCPSRHDAVQCGDASRRQSLAQRRTFFLQDSI